MEIQNKFTMFFFLLALCLLFGNSVSLSAPEKRVEDKSVDFYLDAFRFVGNITLFPDLEEFYVPVKTYPMLEEYLKGQILGETVTIDKAVVAYKWSLQYENMDPMDDHHIYFFTGAPIHQNANEWLESNLDLVMKEFEKSKKGKEYLNISFPSFYLADTQQLTNDQSRSLCVNEYKATKKSIVSDTDIHINSPFLFVLIRNRDTNVLFTKYINDPSPIGKLCPSLPYSVSSHTVSIQAKDGGGSGSPAVATPEKKGPVFSSPGFVLNAVIEEIQPDKENYDSRIEDFPYLRMFLNGKEYHSKTMQIISFEAKTHLEAKWNRFVVFLFYPSTDRGYSGFSFDSYSKLIEKMSSLPTKQIRIHSPPYLATVNHAQYGTYMECLHNQKSLPSSKMEWDEKKSVKLQYFENDVYFMVYDYIYNTTITTGKLHKPSNPETCRLH